MKYSSLLLFLLSLKKKRKSLPASHYKVSLCQQYSKKVLKKLIPGRAKKARVLLHQEGVTLRLPGFLLHFAKCFEQGVGEGGSTFLFSRPSNF